MKHLHSIPLCPDAQSPELDVVCPPDLDLIGPVARYSSDVLPFTGFGAAVLILVAVLFLAVGYWLVRRST